jgi:hypothetical protein
MLHRLDKAMQASPPGGAMQGVTPLIPTGQETAITPQQAGAGIRNQGPTSTAARTAILAASVSAAVSLGLFALVFGGVTTPQRPVTVRASAEGESPVAAAASEPRMAYAPSEQSKQAAKQAALEALQAPLPWSPGQMATTPKVEVKSEAAPTTLKAASTASVVVADIAPTIPPATHKPEVSPSASSTADLDAVQLLRRGLNMLSSGNVNAAQLLLERAADLGSGDAAYALATTYDAAPGAPRTGADVRPNIELALRWYERASELGIEGARKRLSKLKKSSISAR